MPDMAMLFSFLSGNGWIAALFGVFGWGVWFLSSQANKIENHETRIKDVEHNLNSSTLLLSEVRITIARIDANIEALKDRN